MKLLAHRLMGYDASATVVRVKSWIPFLDPHGVGWPTVLVDRYGRRETAARIWQWPIRLER